MYLKILLHVHRFNYSSYASKALRNDVRLHVCEVASKHSDWLGIKRSDAMETAWIRQMALITCSCICTTSLLAQTSYGIYLVANISHGSTARTDNMMVRQLLFCFRSKYVPPKAFWKTANMCARHDQLRKRNQIQWLVTSEVWHLQR